MWIWTAPRGCAISARIQEITGIDYGSGRGRVTVARPRRELITIPARLAKRGRTLFLPPGPNLLETVLPRLQRLPNPG